MYDDNILPNIHGFELLLIRNFITQGTMGKVSSVCITFAGTAERLCSSCARLHSIDGFGMNLNKHYVEKNTREHTQKRANYIVNL